MTLFLLLFILLLLLPDAYIWLAFVRGSVPLAWSIAWWLPSAFALAALGAAAAGHFTDWLIKFFFIVLLCMAVPKLLFALFSITGRSMGLFAPYAAHVGNIAGIVLAAAACLAFSYGFARGWKRLEVKEQNVSFRDLPPAFDGYRILQLSDLHVGTFGSDSRFLRELVERINALQPDLIVFTGDLVNISPDEMKPFQGILSQLQAHDGVYSILGNHDYCEYRRYDAPDGAARSLAELKRIERAMGWRLLLNERHTIRRGADTLELIGVENDSRPPFPSRGDLRKATETIPAGAFKILLSHDPTHWRREVLPATDIQLTLSGHTHAMQLKIGSFSPSSWTYPEWGGLYFENDRALHVSTGTGGNIPFRLGAWPEITLLTLHRHP